MNINRRTMMVSGLAATGLMGVTGFRSLRHSATRSLLHPATSANTDSIVHAIIPVINDGHWLWKEQPENEKGMLDGREYDVSVGIKWKTDGSTRNIKGSTVAPISFPEQEIISFEIQAPDGCDADVVPLTESSAQLQVMADHLERGQELSVKAIYRMKLFRACPKYSADQFPVEQTIERSISDLYLGNSPGIRSSLNAVKKLAGEISSRHDHPWSKAEKYFAWVWENIQGKPGVYTSVQKALENKTGDCEERAGVFIALCRASGIPARLVWVPNHSWAEFCLFDADGIAHWIPAHTAAYSWFGWTGAHELVLQKGDRIYQPGQDTNVRLITDWHSFQGRRPTIEFTGEMTPVPADGDTAEPGGRKKNSHAGWDLVGQHSANKHLRP